MLDRESSEWDWSSDDYRDNTSQDIDDNFEDFIDEY